MASLVKQIQNPNGRVFRRAFVRRKSATTGLFESTWQDISNDVKQWGTITKEIDPVLYSRSTFSDVMLKMSNDGGTYNPNDAPQSLWFGFGDQQRSLVKIECGFIHQTLSSNGIWTNTEYPTTSTVYVGIISGDIGLSDMNEVIFPVRPLVQLFRDFPSKSLVGFTSTGVTASQFMNLVRDMTDGSGSYIFRPFFGDTTTNWVITSTTNVYSNLNTATAEDLQNMTVWDVMEKLAETEDMVAFIDNNGSFKFQTKGANTTGASFLFSGLGTFDTTWGHTIKRITKFGKKFSEYYSRVEIKYVDLDTTTSIITKQSTFVVSGPNTPWNLGHRTFRVENFWIPNTSTADTIATNIFNNVNSLKEQIEFTSSFVPHLGILDRIQVTYDSAGEGGLDSRWDLKSWADDNTDTSSDLIWDSGLGDAIKLDAAEFKLKSLMLDLDNLETKFIANKV